MIGHSKHGPTIHDTLRRGLIFFRFFFTGGRMGAIEEKHGNARNL